MRDDSCSGVGARKDRELEPSGPEGGVGSLWRKSSSMLLCSLLFSPWKGKREAENDVKSGPGRPKGKAQQLRLCELQNYSRLRSNTFFRGATSPGE